MSSWKGVALSSYLQVSSEGRAVDTRHNPLPERRTPSSTTGKLSAQKYNLLTVSVGDVTLCVWTVIQYHKSISYVTLLDHSKGKKSFGSLQKSGRTFENMLLDFDNTWAGLETRKRNLVVFPHVSVCMCVCCFVFKNRILHLWQSVIPKIGSCNISCNPSLM